MNKIKVFLLFITVVISVFANAQHVKPQFKQLKLVTYTIEGPGTGQHVIITSILEIDKKRSGA
ncbi:MAG: hypothetical protein JST32_12365 [Bacteroidetes bacterium]|nr:hypothetical protein [Bacteroidota bacterium]